MSDEDPLKASNKTAGDCPDFAVPWEQNGTVPFFRDSFETASSRFADACT